MAYQTKKTAVIYSIDIEFIMLVTLYFDYVIPFWRTMDVPKETLPIELREGDLRDRLVKFHNYDIECQDYIPYGMSHPDSDLFYGAYLQFTVLYRAFKKASQVEDTIIETDEPATFVTLLRIPIVDKSKLSWEKVINFRKEKDELASLRKLALVFENDYSGKSQTWVEDHILDSLYTYEQTVARMGLETKLSSLSILVNSKTLLPATGIAFAAALLGEPITAITAASVGLLRDIGKISLNIAQRRLKLQEFRESHPLKYLIDVKNQFGN